MKDERMKAKQFKCYRFCLFCIALSRASRVEIIHLRRNFRVLLSSGVAQKVVQPVPRTDSTLYFMVFVFPLSASGEVVGGEVSDVRHPTPTPPRLRGGEISGQDLFVQSPLKQ